MAETRNKLPVINLNSPEAVDTEHFPRAIHGFTNREALMVAKPSLVLASVGLRQMVGMEFVILREPYTSVAVVAAEEVPRWEVVESVIQTLAELAAEKFNITDPIGYLNVLDPDVAAAEVGLPTGPTVDYSRLPRTSHFAD